MTRLAGSSCDAGACCSWLCREEWEEVYSWLYSSEPGLVKKGVGRVAAWQARGKVPMMVELTANLCECRVCDREKVKVGTAFQLLSLQYSMAITRFANGIGDIAMDTMNIRTNLLTCVAVYGIPSWVVTLRHSGTHEKLPSLGALRAGAEFCLSWLRANYWRPQRLTIGEDKSESRTSTPPVLEEAVSDRRRGGGKQGRETETREGHVWRLTHGLCHSRDQLLTLLVHADYKELSDCLKQEQLLQFPPSIKYAVEVPELSDLDALSSLIVGEGDMGVWQTHLVKAAKSSCSVKQRLVSALICTVNDADCSTSLRHFLCGWLNTLLKSDSLVETDAQVINILDSDEENDVFLPGMLDWIELLQVAKHHPGYYLYAILKEIMKRFNFLLAEPAVDNVLHLSALATLSSRIGHVGSHTSPPHHHHTSPSHQASGRHDSQDLQRLRSLWHQKVSEAGKVGEAGTSSKVEGQEGCVVGLEGGMEGIEGCVEGQEGSMEGIEECREGTETKRWTVVEDMSVWLSCPIGMCPEQQVSVNMFDPPLLPGVGDGHHGDGNVQDSSPQQEKDMIGEAVILPAAGTVMVDEGIADSGTPLHFPSKPFTLGDHQIQQLQQLTRIL